MVKLTKEDEIIESLKNRIYRLDRQIARLKERRDELFDFLGEIGK